MIRYLARQLPIGVLVTTGAVGVAWAISTHLDTTFERTVLAALTTLGVSLAVADRSHALTAASPTTALARRTPRVLLALGVTFGGWLLAVAAAAVVGAEGHHPDRWDLVQWVVVAGSQIAAGALVATLRPADPGLPVGAFVAAVWCACTAGRAHAALYEVADHVATWLALGLAFTAATWSWSRDPARRRRLPR